MFLPVPKLAILPDTSGVAAATTGQVLTWNGSAWAPATPSSGVITETSITGTTFISSAPSSMGKLYVCSGTSSNYTVTLPTIDGTYDGMNIGFRMDPALTKLVTITGTGTQTIDGTLARIMHDGETCNLEARGSKWYKLSGRTLPYQGQVNRSASNYTGISDTTWTPIPMDFLVNGPSYLFASAAFVAPRAGFYMITAFAYVQNISSGLYVGVSINSASPASYNTPALVATNAAGTFAWGFNLSAGDTVQPTIFCGGHTGTLTVLGSGAPAAITAVEVQGW